MAGATLSEPPHLGRYSLLYTLHGRVLVGGTTRRISNILPKLRQLLPLSPRFGFWCHPARTPTPWPLRSAIYFTWQGSGRWHHPAHFQHFAEIAVTIATFAAFWLLVPPVPSLSEPPHLSRYAPLYTLRVVVLAGATSNRKKGVKECHLG